MATTTNDLSRKRIYTLWNAMLGRCYRPSQTSYRLYGGKGIGVCDRWRKFENFYADMRLSYREGLSLDRVDNTKNYSPGNCRWATNKEQSRNTSRNRFITIDNKTQTLSAWIEERGVKSSTVRQRYYVYKWDIGRALGMGG